MSQPAQMKVLLISNYRPDAQQSMLRYAELLRSGLSSEGYAVELITPPVIVGELPFVKGPLKKWFGYIDKYLFAPRYLRRKARQADIVHVCDHSNSMYLKCAGSKPALITCHDLLAIFSAQGRYRGVRIGFTGRMLQRWIASRLSHAKHIVCVSQKTLEDVQTLSPKVHAEMRVIHHSLNWNYSPAASAAVSAVMKKTGLAENAEYFFHVGGNQWYKNRLGVMQIFTALRKFERFRNVKLVMAGKPWPPALRDYCSRMGLQSEMIECRTVSNEELQALYSGAQALLFPSKEEGFGWPVLEAQACGCPVITSNRAPMTEIAGAGALFVDPENPEVAAQTVAEHFAELQSLRSAGFENLARFAQAIAIRKYQEVYQQMRDSPPAAQ
jgi:glycosyltransferase involved in cell wall biosynthesis